MAGTPSWEAVWQGNGEAQAQIIADGLANRGIRARPQGARQNAGGLPHAFQMNTWAVFVPLTQAAEARAVLRNQGEDSGVINGLTQSRSDMRATLGFFAAVIVGCTLFAVFLAIREAW